MNAMQALLRARAAWARRDHQLELQFYEDEHAETRALDQQPVSPSLPAGGVVGLGDGLLIERSNPAPPLAGGALDSTSTRRLATTDMGARAVAGGDSR